MTREELVRDVALKTDMSVKDAKSAVDATLDTICKGISQGEEVSFAGFGCFGLKKVTERLYMNPKTGEKVLAGGYYKPTFKAGKTLREAAKSYE